MPEIIIDGISHEVKEGKNLLETILSLGYDLPYFCWHPAMGSVGSCRQCAIKKFKDEDDDQGMLVMSCMEPVQDGMLLSIENDEAHDFRKNVIEWLMTNHPHDCPVCDEGGECHLQDMTVMAGHAYRRFRYKKRTYENQDLGPCINHEMNRCIQCYRCVRFYQDYAGGDDLEAMAAHNHVYFGRHEDGTLESEFSGNLVEVCPTGVFTDKTLKKHYTRKWDMTSAPSICQHCSLGCNTIANERYGGLRRIKSRYNSEVNGYFICDRGRFGYEFVNSEQRISKPQIEKKEVTPSEVIKKTTEVISERKTMAIGSPKASLESNYALLRLVGEDNFFMGITEKENQLHQTALKILKEGSVKTPSLKEIESCDAVIIIGEDVTNTAPMMDLAIKQALLQQPKEKAKQLQIPEWNDSAVRELIQDDRGPFFILTSQKTKLDQLATDTFRVSPQEMAKIAFAITYELDNRTVKPENIPTEWNEKIKKIAEALTQAKKPLVISGTSLGDENLLTASANLAKALAKGNEETRLSFVFEECNSLGTAFLTTNHLGQAVERADQYDNLIVLENDLSLRIPALDGFMSDFKNIIALDHTQNTVTEKAAIVIPAGTFAEATGTLINNEGRAQRFFQVQETTENIKASWKWLTEIGKQLSNNEMQGWVNLDSVLQSMESKFPGLKGVSEAAPSANHKNNGQKIPRQPHRYSGRTAMHAHDQVNEPKPPEDNDSPLSYTMEGYQDKPDGALTSFFWSPGWNSEQAINKFQIEVGGPLQGGVPGIRLIDSADQELEYFPIPEKQKTEKWQVIPVHQIFGSEELSYKSPAIKERSKGPFAVLHPDDIELLNLAKDENISIQLSKSEEIALPIITQKNWPRNTIGISYGFPETGKNLPANVKLKTGEDGA